MNVYRVTLSVIDFDEIGEDEVRGVIENARYPNHCISPDVHTIETRDIGEWSDDHPLNQRDTSRAEFERLFGPPATSNVAALVDAARRVLSDWDRDSLVSDAVPAMDALRAAVDALLAAWGK